jgi:Domain of unknown function (DUF4296)
MNKKSANTGLLPGKIILALVCIIMMTISCLKKEEKTHFKNLIPEKDFISILNDLHLTNGLLALPEIRNRYMGSDTSGLYVEIIESYGYTTAQMDTTIQYYYIKKPKKLIRIYDQILGKFSEIQTRTEKELQNSPDFVRNQWKGRSSYLLPDTGRIENLAFEITMMSPGKYSLEFSVTVYPDDQSYNPCFTAWFCNADSAETGSRNYLPSIKYIKDGRPHDYVVTGTNTRNTAVLFKMLLYDCSGRPDCYEPDARIEGITFNYSGSSK